MSLDFLLLRSTVIPRYQQVVSCVSEPNVAATVPAYSTENDLRVLVPAMTVEPSLVNGDITVAPADQKTIPV